MCTYFTCFPLLPMDFIPTDTLPTQTYPLSLHDALPISDHDRARVVSQDSLPGGSQLAMVVHHHLRLQEQVDRSEEHTSELQSRGHLVCRLLLEKKIILML